MARLKQGIKLKYARNKKAKYTVKSIKYRYKKTTTNNTTTYSYKKNIIKSKKQKYCYKV